MTPDEFVRILGDATTYLNEKPDARKDPEVRAACKAFTDTVYERTGLHAEGLQGFRSWADRYRQFGSVGLVGEL